MYILGFDIGGTKYAVLLVEMLADWEKFLGRYQTETVHDWRRVADMLADRGEMMMVNCGVDWEACRIRISCCWPLNAGRKWILFPSILPGWENVPIADYFSERLGDAAKSEADACALAEWRFGAGRESRNSESSCPICD